MNGIDLIKKWEGLRLTAYICPAGVLTIGWGHTKGVKRGDTITEYQAEKFLQEDYNEAKNAVKRLVSVSLNENQLGALISFVFNLGIGSLAKSTLLKLLNQGKYLEASDEFVKWNHVNGQPSVGLTNRRLEEKQLFNKV